MRRVTMLLSLLLALSLVFVACDKKDKGKKGTKKSSKVDEDNELPPGVAGPDGTWANDLEDDLDMECPDAAIVAKADLTTPEGVVYAIYKAALDGRAKPTEDAAHFAAFYAHFAAKNTQDWVNKQYWPRIKEHIPKYTKSNEDASFLICKKQTKSDGSVKMYIKSWFPKKSNPPIILVPKENGGWVIDTFSY